MKTMITALVAMAMSYNASAGHLHNAECPVNCPNKTFISAPVSKSFDQAAAELKSRSEDRNSLLRYAQTMQQTLMHIEKQKLQDAIENLEAEQAYNNLMAGLLSQVEHQKLADQLEDLSAANRFQHLMAKIFADTVAK